jgi:nucleotidyltransferase/DNA polymerase involved in DNA repair
LEKRKLADLYSVGPATLRDLKRLGITSVEQLAHHEAADLYERLCRIEGRRIDPCCQDVFSAAVAQARDPDLPAELHRWWAWSRKRKAGETGECGPRR